MFGERVVVFFYLLIFFKLHMLIVMISPITYLPGFMQL